MSRIRRAGCEIWRGVRDELRGVRDGAKGCERWRGVWGEYKGLFM